MISKKFIEKLKSHSDTAPHKAAIISDSKEMNYAQLYDQTLRAMSYLLQCGIGKGITVGITLPDEIDHLIVTLALTGIGARQIVLPVHDSITLRQDIASRVGVSVQILDHSNNSIGGKFVEFPPPCRPDTVRASQIQHEQSILYLKTSGTTSRTNIVEFTEADIASQASRHQEYSNESLLRLATVEHNNSKRHRLYCIWNGGTNILKPTGMFDIVAYSIEKKVTCLDISRLHAIDLLHNPRSGELAPIKVRTGGSSIPYTLRKEIERRITKQLYVRYAATECGAISMANPDEHDEDECCGRALDGVSIQIVDHEDNTVQAGSIGQIRLRSEGMAQRYFDNQQQTERRFKDGWFYPGDLGSIHDDGQVILHGRADDMIIMNGLNIYPAEIERVLESSPKIRAAAAFPIESKIHGQIPIAAIEGEITPLEVDEMLKLCREKLGIRSPRKILVLPSLPRNMQGKVLKSEIMNSYNSQGRLA